jgi:hypothetical protein
MKTLADEMNEMKRFQYRRIDISTLAGLKEAERLQANGWKAISGGLFTVLMEKRG